jgi:hypothetical protein
MSTETGKNITISKTSQEILDKFEATGYFGENQNDIAKIAISYALGNSYDTDIDLVSYTSGKEETFINKWAIGAIKDQYFEDLLKVIRPEVENINIALRNLIDIGLKKMNEDLWDNALNKLIIKKLF